MSIQQPSPQQANWFKRKVQSAKDLLSVVADLLGVGTAIGITAAAPVVFLSALMAQILGFVEGVLSYAAVGCGTALAGVGLATVMAARRRRRMFFGYKKLITETIFTIDGQDFRRHRAHTRVHLYFERDQVRVFEYRYHYTGRDVGITEIRTPGCRLLGPPVEEGNPGSYLCFIYLGRPYSRGEQLTMVIDQTFYDVTETAVPKLAMTVREPIDELVMTVRLPDTYPLGNAELLYYKTADQHALHSKRTVLNPLPSNKLIEYRVKKPKFGHRYKIDWGPYPP